MNQNKVEFKNLYIQELLNVTLPDEILELNREELGKVEGGKATQNLTEESYEFMRLSAMTPINALRTHALLKYGPGNHLHINALENYDRAVRHIYASISAVTDDEGSKVTELTHALFRIMMGFEASMYSELEGTDELRQVEILYNSYNNANGDYKFPEMFMFPIAWRRMSTAFSMMPRPYDLKSVNSALGYCIAELTSTVQIKKKNVIKVACILYHLISVLDVNTPLSLRSYQEIFFDDKSRKLFDDYENAANSIPIGIIPVEEEQNGGDK